jgi:peptidoglycan hydrolase-like protein with peptidoglycan-binding domain
MRQRKFIAILGCALVLLCALAFTGAASPTAFAASTSATSATTSCPPDITYGTSNASLVRELQNTLNRDYQISVTAQANEQYQNIIFLNSPYNFSPLLTVDGDFGTHTGNAVKDFQSFKLLHVDGDVGNNTWHALGYC